MSSLNATPTGERIHIGIFGKRNAGKSSLINAITTQKIAIVSDFKGTTTDPVFKAMELLPLGPVMIIDTPGIDDEGELGKLRVEKAYQILNKTNIAILVIDSTIGISPEDVELLNLIKEKKVPVIIAFNKCELLTDSEIENLKADVPNMFVSAATGEN
ncbi:MAG: 50S ribosome-binding GTPase, partial [Phascolarctobacterium sp.]|nr:50S ribosome-binding GTPase [Phascolarctobacterium sp.]